MAIEARTLEGKKAFSNIPELESKNPNTIIPSTKKKVQEISEL